jgi:GH24 family phage-related lysozyme (muramidase)
VPPKVDDPSITPEELEYRRIQRNLAEYNAHDVDGLLGMIGAGERGPRAPKKKATADQAQHILRKETLSMVENGVVEGAIGPLGAKRARQEIAAEPNMSAMRAEAMIERAQKEVLNELGDRGTLISGVTNMISEKERLRPQAYPDGDDMSIGWGFYMGNKGADKRLKDLGYDPAKLRAGTEVITEEDATFLRDQDIQRSLNYVRGRLEEWGHNPADLANHQLQALIDLHYNAGNQMFGTGMEAAFRSDDWKTLVGLEIRDKSNVSGNKGQQARRNSEFNVWQGLVRLSQSNPGEPRRKPEVPGTFGAEKTILD